MSDLFPAAHGVKGWHKALLGAAPFSGDSRTAAEAFFLPARSLCRRPVAAEAKLPVSIPAALRKDLRLALRFWQASQRVTADFVSGGALFPGMDKPMTLNFAMALGNYSRFFLFSGAGRLTGDASLALHAAFAEEMTRMPAAMALPPKARGPKHSPAASALRLAAAFSAALKKGER
ncbi:MAG TPA: hypothetical protein DEQ38_08050 [Elusimicrobia bacterium]|nr:MAG: hypothetical protein A2089_06090 [Elusimicrobia bacterium GWD2_63_28]HCC48048.1 hypothetical protein [Elusimicrobiota bacterium]